MKLHARARERSPFFDGMARKVCQYYPEVERGCVFARDTPVIIAHIYFTLSDLYKAQRNQDGSLTDDVKKAAIHGLAVMAVSPFRPLDPNHVESPFVLHANPVLALACMQAWLPEYDLFFNKFDLMKRHYFSLRRVRFSSFDAWIKAYNQDTDVAAHQPTQLARDEVRLIDEWTTKIELDIRREQ